MKNIIVRGERARQKSSSAHNLDPGVKGLNIETKSEELNGDF